MPLSVLPVSAAAGHNLTPSHQLRRDQGSSTLLSECLVSNVPLLSTVYQVRGTFLPGIQSWPGDVTYAPGLPLPLIHLCCGVTLCGGVIAGFRRVMQVFLSCLPVWWRE